MAPLLDLASPEEGGGENGGGGVTGAWTPGASRLSNQSFAVADAAAAVIPAVDAAEAGETENAGQEVSSPEAGGAAAPASNEAGTGAPASPLPPDTRDGALPPQSAAAKPGAPPAHAAAESGSAGQQAEHVSGKAAGLQPAALAALPEAASAAAASAAEQPAPLAAAAEAGSAETAQPFPGSSVNGAEAAGSVTAAHPNTNAEGDLLHPWSLANPTPLTAPKPAAAAPATISLADATSPVGGWLNQSRLHLSSPKVDDILTFPVSLDTTSNPRFSAGQWTRGLRVGAFVGSAHFRLALLRNWISILTMCAGEAAASDSMTNPHLHPTAIPATAGADAADASSDAPSSELSSRMQLAGIEVILRVP